MPSKRGFTKNTGHDCIFMAMYMHMFDVIKIYCIPQAFCSSTNNNQKQNKTNKFTKV